MKKILISFLLILSFFMYSHGNTYAADRCEPGEDTIKITVTEKVPGACCTGEPGKFECNVKKGFGSVVEMMGAIIKYFTFLAGLAGVLYLIINGIMYSMGGMDSGMKDEAKKRIAGTIVGLIILFMSGVILNIIAPWVYK